MTSAIGTLLRVGCVLHSPPSLLIIMQACERQESCCRATKELTRDLEAFLSIQEQVINLKDRPETKAAIERMLELIMQISDFISEHATSSIYGA